MAASLLIRILIKFSIHQRRYTSLSHCTLFPRRLSSCHVLCDETESLVTLQERHHKTESDERDFYSYRSEFNTDNISQVENVTVKELIFYVHPEPATCVNLKVSKNKYFKEGSTFVKNKRWTYLVR